MITELPMEAKEASDRFDDYSVLLYGREKIGKTITASTFPDLLFLATEPGHKGLRVKAVTIETWGDIRSVLKLLKKDNERKYKYKWICFDTVDRAYEICLDWVCEKRGIEYPGETADGKEDFGKSWKAVRKEFLSVIHEFNRLGIGIMYISHANESVIKSRGGESYTRIFPSMSKQARGVIEGIVDFFFYCDYMRNSKGENIRVIITQGDEMVWAGSRKSAGKFPPIMELTEKGGYRNLVEGFNGRIDGLNPKTLLPGKTTGKATAILVSKMRNAKALPSSGSAKKKPMLKRRAK